MQVICSDAKAEFTGPDFIEKFPYYTPKVVEDFSETTAGVESCVSLVLLIESSSPSDAAAMRSSLLNMARKEVVLESSTLDDHPTSRSIEKFFVASVLGPRKCVWGVPFPSSFRNKIILMLSVWIIIFITFILSR